ncbi:MAG TPA: arginine--tRNA ligase [Erysipelotrichaceae bacterium]|nr:arginine--tRNA ligase [Erysipelotrichaceae bacterium]
MNKIEQKIKAAISAVLLSEYEFEADSDIIVEIPKDNTHGDYSTNIAMRIVKKLKMSPQIIANNLVSKLKENTDLFTEVIVAGPGFINFRVNQKHFANVIKQAIEEEKDFGSNNSGNGLKVNVEYVSANPTGDLHPGHARGAAAGDSLTRLMKFSGYDVTREFYLNDAGVQIDTMARSLQVRYLNLFGEEIPMPEDSYHGQDIIDIAKKLKSEVGAKYVSKDLDEYIEDFKVYGLKEETAKLKRDLDLFRVEFDVWTTESSIYEAGKVEAALDKVIKSGHTYESEGALWLKTTDFGDDKDRVLIKSDKTYTYLVPDIAYHQDKFDRGYDQLVDLLGADHHGYINRLKAAIQILGYDKDQLEVDITQMALMLKDGEEFKMSKRTGQSISLRELISEVGVDALRYFYVDRAADSPMQLDLDLAIKQSNENPVYYAQYAHARMCSILTQGQKYKQADDYSLVNAEKEIELLKHINEFSNVIADAAKVRQPHKISNYIQKLASLFHSFYGQHKVLDDSNPQLTSQRLGLVLASKITLKNALNLIGVSAPESM